jgi:hypothetical protein
MSQPVSPFCIYSIRQQHDLDEAYRAGGSSGFTEHKVWKTGQRLFLEAEKHGQRMPVIFASADVTDKLLYYAVLSNLVIDEASSTTSYQFNHLEPVMGELPLSSLRLRSTNRPLSDDYIRPYAICHTPSFIS